MNTGDPVGESGNVPPSASRGAESLVARSPQWSMRRQKARTFEGSPGPTASDGHSRIVIGGTEWDSTAMRRIRVGHLAELSIKLSVPWISGK
jgi:hypothetical protein